MDIFTTMITPYLADGSVDLETARKYVDWYFENGLTGIFAVCQSSEIFYLTLEEREGRALFSFKNTSRYALDVTAEELMERFVRGDSSRSTEGSGLGLSIARSLTEIQGGTLALTVDGDLFKAVVSFPLR